MSKIISFSGIDGCGKTSIITQLRKRLLIQGKTTKYVWLRYNHYLTKLLLGFCRITGYTKYENIKGIRVGYHEFYRSRFVSYLFIFLTYIDTLAATIFAVYIPSIFTKHIVVCDRWVFDIIVDLEVDTGINFSEKSFFIKAFKKLIPQRASCFLIQRNIQCVTKSRPEHIHDRNFIKRFRLFEQFVEDQRIKTIDNNASIENSVEKVLNTLI